jgi:hypothetical protein
MAFIDGKIMVYQIDVYVDGFTGVEFEVFVAIWNGGVEFILYHELVEAKVNA